jgi:hypothetical protein
VFDPPVFGPNEVELGSGHFDSDQWWLVYDPEGPESPDEHHIREPVITLYAARGGFGRPPARRPLSGSLGRPALGLSSDHTTARVFGEVDFGFHGVSLQCLTGPIVEAVVVDCADHLPFNYYVAEVTSRVMRITATGPDGRTATWEREE